MRLRTYFNLQHCKTDAVPPKFSSVCYTSVCPLAMCIRNIRIMGNFLKTWDNKLCGL